MSLSVQIVISSSHPPLPQIFPLFRALGANGLLIEYEDMFPYEGHLRLLRAKHAYRYPSHQARRCLCRENGVCGAATWKGGEARRELNDSRTVLFCLVKCVSLIIKIKHVH